MSFCDLFSMKNASEAYVEGRIDREFRKLAKRLSGVSEGHIGFVGVEKWKLIKDIENGVNKRYRNQYVSDELITVCYNTRLLKEKEYFEFEDIMGLEGSSFGIYEFDKYNSKSVVFYANNVSINENFATDLVNLWTNVYVISVLGKEVWIENGCPYMFDKKAEKVEKEFYYTPILRAIEYYLERSLSEEEQYEIFAKVFSNYGIKIDKMNYNINGLYSIVVSCN